LYLKIRYRQKYLVLEVTEHIVKRGGKTKLSPSIRCSRSSSIPIGADFVVGAPEPPLFTNNQSKKVRGCRWHTTTITKLRLDRGNIDEDDDGNAPEEEVQDANRTRAKNSANRFCCPGTAIWVLNKARERTEQLRFCISAALAGRSQKSH
jgi:hypothetical protein